MNVFISNGLKDKENPTEYVNKCNAAVKQMLNTNYNLLHSFRPGEYEKNIEKYGLQKTRIYMLGQTISRELADCDLLVLMDDWYNYDGCFTEFLIAKNYGIPIKFCSTEDIR